jgi:hypothetical protein
MIALGAPTKSDDLKENQHRKHIKALWHEYNSFVSGRNQPYVLSPQNPFADWDIAQRYAGSKYFDRNIVDPHRKEAKSLFKLLQQATT